MDPPVCVCDEGGRHVISLVSGHLGGANELAKKIAKSIGATPVITTATDINNLPAIDIIAKWLDLHIDNIQAIKNINSTLLIHGWVYTIDPHNYLREFHEFYAPTTYKKALEGNIRNLVYISEFTPYEFYDSWLFLRPKVLILGIGLNSGTSDDEILDAIKSTLEANRLSIHSIKFLSTIDKKANESGLVLAAKRLGVEVKCVDISILQTVEVPNPSKIVMEKIGTPSVAEACALVTSRMGRLIVPKTKRGNVTIAIAKERSLS